jgi:hypothetical protein
MIWLWVLLPFDPYHVSYDHLERSEITHETVDYCIFHLLDLILD